PWVQQLEIRGGHARTGLSSAVFVAPPGEARSIKEAVDAIVAERTAGDPSARPVVVPPPVVEAEPDDDADQGALADGAAGHVEDGADEQAAAVDGAGAAAGAGGGGDADDETSGD